MSEKTYTTEELLAVWKKVEAEKIQKFEAELQMLRARELKKALVPPHKHNEGTTASAGVEDVPAPKMVAKAMLCKECGYEHPMDKPHVKKNAQFGYGSNPNAPVVPSAAMKKDVAPSPMGKAMMSDDKGKLIDTGKVAGSKQADDTNSKHVNKPENSDPGSGGVITKGPKAIRKKAGGPAKAITNKPVKKFGAPKKAIDEMDGKLPQSPEKAITQKSEPLMKPPVSQAQRAAMGAAASGNSTLGIPKKVGKEFINADQGGKLPAHKAEKESSTCGAKVGETMAGGKPSPHYCTLPKGHDGQHGLKPSEAKKAEPPMAKPPSGKNMATAIPTSKPMAAPKMGMAKEEKGAVNPNVIQKAADKESVYREKYTKEKQAAADKQTHADHAKMKHTIRNLSPNSPFKQDLHGTKKDEMSEMAAPDSVGASMKSEMRKDAMGETGATSVVTKPMGGGGKKPGIFGRLHGAMHAGPGAAPMASALPKPAPAAKPAVPAMAPGANHAAQAPTVPGAGGSQIAKPLAPMPKLTAHAQASGVKQYGQGLPTVPGGPGANKTVAGRPTNIATAPSATGPTGTTVGKGPNKLPFK